MTAAARIGISVDEWERLTPRELAALLIGFEEKVEEQTRINRLMIYNLAVAVRTMIWSKSPPSFEEMFPKDQRQKEMTDDEMFEQVKVLNALFGGKED